MAWIRDALWLLLAWISPKRHVHGVEAFIAEEFDLKVGFSELEAALRLISTYDPNRLRRLQRDVKRILIAGASGAVYIPRLRTCRIGVAYLKREDPLRLAMVLVHEATHARLSRRGFRYHPHRRARIEKVCIEAEVAFAERVPGSGDAIAELREITKQPWWSNDHAIARSIDELRRLGCPEWLIERMIP